MMSEDSTAEDLLTRAASRDVVAFSELYDLYAPRVYGLIEHILHSRAAAEEVLQEAFVRLWMESPQLSEQGRSVAAWLIVTARGTAIDRLRGLRLNSGGNGLPSSQVKPEKGKTGVPRRTKAAHPTAAAPKVAEGRYAVRQDSAGDGGRPPAPRALHLAWLPQPREINLIDDRLGLLHKAIDQLPKAQRQALEFALFHGMLESEIAEKLGEPLGRVRSSLRAALTYVKHRRRAVCGSWAANI